MFISKEMSTSATEPKYACGLLVTNAEGGASLVHFISENVAGGIRVSQSWRQFYSREEATKKALTLWESNQDERYTPIIIPLNQAALPIQKMLYERLQ